MPGRLIFQNIGLGKVRSLTSRTFADAALKSAHSIQGDIAHQSALRCWICRLKGTRFVWIGLSPSSEAQASATGWARSSSSAVRGSLNGRRNG